MRPLLILLIFIFVLSCTGTKHSKKGYSTPEVLNIAGDYFKGQNFHFTYNKDSTLLLCYKGQNLQNKQGFKKLKLVVFYVRSGDVIYKNQLNFGSVKWVGHYTIEMTSGKGFINDNDNARIVRRYNVIKEQYLEKNK